MDAEPTVEPPPHRLQDRPPAFRAAAAVVAGLVGIASLAYAATILIRDAVDARSQPPTTVVGAPPTSAPNTTESTTPTTGVSVDGLVTFVDLDFDDLVIIEHGSADFSVEVPEDWVDTSEGDWFSDGAVIGERISAARDIDAWFEGWDTPGAFIGVTRDRDPESLFGEFSDACAYAGRTGVPLGVYSGEAEVWVDCGDPGSTLVIITGEVGSGASMLVQVIVVDADWLGFTAITESVFYAAE